MKGISSTLSLLTVLSLSEGYSPNPAITTAAKGMNLLKPIFQAEAQLQAAALGALGKVDKEEIVNELSMEKLESKKEKKALIFTYGLSPFSSEAVNILEQSGYEYKVIELGAEWFALGPKGSVKRIALSEELESGATSLPKIFLGDECIGGCSELAGLVESGELDKAMSSAKVAKKGGSKSSGPFSFFQ